MPMSIFMSMTMAMTVTMTMTMAILEERWADAAVWRLLWCFYAGAPLGVGDSIG